MIYNYLLASTLLLLGGETSHANIGLIILSKLLKVYDIYFLLVRFSTEI